MGLFSGRWTGFLLVMLACLSLSVRESAATGGFPKPPICKTLECPSYKVVYSGKDFEIRSYPNALWISTSINSSSFEAATNQGFGP